MIATRRLPNTAPLPIDQELLSFLRACEHDALRRQPQEVALLNLAGQLYRVITIGARRDLEALLAWFRPHGLSNRIQLSEESLIEVDSATGERYLGPYTAVLQIGGWAHPLPE